MKNLLFILLLLGNFNVAKANNLDEINVINDSITKARPQNDINEFKIEFAKALTISNDRILEIGKSQIKIISNFTVDSTGKIQNVKVINDKYNLTEEVTNTFNKLEKWIPAQENGINISSNQSLVFILNISLPDYQLNEKRIPNIVLHKQEYAEFYYEFNSKMIYPRDFWSRYYHKKDAYDSGNKNASSEFKYVIKFTVNEEGKFEDIKTYVDDIYDSYLNSSVKKALNKCSPWEPATINGEKVKSEFTLPWTLSIKQK